MAEINQSFCPDSTLDQQPPVYKFDKQELLKTPDKKNTREKNFKLSKLCIWVNNGRR